MQIMNTFVRRGQPSLLVPRDPTSPPIPMNIDPVMRSIHLRPNSCDIDTYLSPPEPGTQASPSPVILEPVHLAELGVNKAADAARRLEIPEHRAHAGWTYAIKNMGVVYDLDTVVGVHSLIGLFGTSAIHEFTFQNPHKGTNTAIGARCKLFGVTGTSGAPSGVPSNFIAPRLCNDGTPKGRDGARSLGASYYIGGGSGVNGFLLIPDVRYPQGHPATTTVLAVFRHMLVS